MKLFVTGTDTEIGKTYIAVGLVHYFNQKGLSTIGLKPVASGCTFEGNRLINRDALKLQKAASVNLPYHMVNPFSFEPAIAPHIAALDGQTNLSINRLTNACVNAFETRADVAIIEGAGGWMTPLNEQETLADFVSHMDFSVILVVGMRLGCLNHALLTYQSIKHSGCKVRGWVANCIEPNMEVFKDNLETLRNWINAPCLGVIGHNKTPESRLTL